MTLEEILNKVREITKSYDSLPKGSVSKKALKKVIEEMTARASNLKKNYDLLSNINREEIMAIGEEINDIAYLLYNLDGGFIKSRQQAMTEIHRLTRKQYELERDGISIKQKLNKYYRDVTREIPDYDVINPSGKPTPTGEPSKLNELEWSEVRSYKFQRWFGDWERAYETNNYEGVSKVINEDTGEPRVMYHGTAGLESAFTKFTFNRFPMNYFGQDHDYSKWYMEARKQSNPTKMGLIYGVFLDIKNPLDFTEVGIDDLEYQDVLDLFYLKYGIKLPHLRPVEIRAEQVAQAGQKRPLWWYVRIAHEWLHALKKTAYDGFKFLEHIPDASGNNMQSIAWTCFEPQQIKLAGGLNKEFSLISKDIRMAKGGMICG